MRALPPCPSQALFAATALAVGGCALPPLVLTPAGPPAVLCPADGCAGRQAPTPPASPVASAACAEGGEAGRCEGADPRACTEHALSAWASARDVRTLACVAQTFVEACSMADARACAFAGRLLLDGRGVPHDAPRGLTMLLRACDDGVAVACAVGARALGDPGGTDVPDGPEELAHFEAQRTCLAGQGDACLQVGLLFHAGRDGYPCDLARAAASFARGCDLGDARACRELGRSLALADGAPRDPERAAFAYAKACRLGDGGGCSGLGVLAEHGDGAPLDVEKARSLYRGACAAGDARGCLRAEMLGAARAGRGAERPGDARARLAPRWVAACSGGDARACAFAGVAYEDGEGGVARDEAKSLQAMSRACELGERHACEWVKTESDE